jgi:hypothetical protein
LLAPALRLTVSPLSPLAYMWKTRLAWSHRPGVHSITLISLWLSFSKWKQPESHLCPLTWSIPWVTEFMILTDWITNLYLKFQWSIPHIQDNWCIQEVSSQKCITFINPKTFSHIRPGCHPSPPSKPQEHVGFTGFLSLTSVP